MLGFLDDSGSCEASIEAKGKVSVPRDDKPNKCKERSFTKLELRWVTNPRRQCWVILGTQDGDFAFAWVLDPSGPLMAEEKSDGVCFVVPRCLWHWDGVSKTMPIGHVVFESAPLDVVQNFCDSIGRTRVQAQHDRQLKDGLGFQLPSGRKKKTFGFEPKNFANSSKRARFLQSIGSKQPPRAAIPTSNFYSSPRRPSDEWGLALARSLRTPKKRALTMKCTTSSTGKRAKTTSSSGISGKRTSTALSSRKYSRWKPRGLFSSTSTSLGSRSGLQNIGNSCYMNAVLQALLKTRGFTSALQASVETKPSSAVVDLTEAGGAGSSSSGSRLFTDVLVDLHKQAKSNTGVLSAEAVKSSIGSRYSRFAGYSQQDAHEFLVECINQMNEDALRRRKLNLSQQCDSEDLHRDRQLALRESPANKVFHVRLEHFLTCCTCNYERSICESFYDISLDIPTSASAQSGMSSSSSSSSAASSPGKSQVCSVHNKKFVVWTARPNDWHKGRVLACPISQCKEPPFCPEHGHRFKRLKALSTPIVRCHKGCAIRLNEFHSKWKCQGQVSPDKKPDEKWKQTTLEFGSSNLRVFSVEGLLRHFFHPHVIECKCDQEQCGGGEVRMASTFRVLPKLLVLHLKRFTPNYKTQSYEKVRHEVHFEPTLDVGFLCDADTHEAGPKELLPDAIPAAMVPHREEKSEENSSSDTEPESADEAMEAAVVDDPVHLDTSAESSTSSSTGSVPVAVPSGAHVGDLELDALAKELVSASARDAPDAEMKFILAAGEKNVDPYSYLDFYKSTHGVTDTAVSTETAAAAALLDISHSQPDVLDFTADDDDEPELSEEQQLEQAIQLSLLEQDKTNNLGFVRKGQPKTSTKYVLQCVVHHKGYSASSGHYVTDVLGDNNKWKRYDDQYVKPMTAEDVFSSRSRRSAYILIYKKKE